MPSIKATLFTDPGCPWAYSARPALSRLWWRFGDQLDWQVVLIGLSETREDYAKKGYTPQLLASGWRKFQDRFGMPFAIAVKPGVAATSRACRAVVAVRESDPALTGSALRALQIMQFTTTGMLDDDEALRGALATVPGLDAAAVIELIDAPAVREAYDADRLLARAAAGKPTHVQNRTATSDGSVRYTAPSVVFEAPDGRSLEVGGFQPFEAYDTALANLDPSLERRAGPESVADALAAFPDGLTTAEAAAIMRAELDDPDRQGVEKDLIALAGDGVVHGEAAGGGSIWRLGPPV